jgi:CheY-like chemotaxis protein
MQPQKRILVIDDNRSMVLAAEKILQKEGYDVTTAYDGIEGIEKTMEVKPDLIISDIVMPRMNGYKMCRELKKNAETSKIPLIFLTVKGQTDEIKGSSAEGLKEIDEAYACGASGILTKPVGADELLQAVENVFWLESLGGISVKS